MEKIDRLILKANSVNRGDGGVHILREGYCLKCHGICRAPLDTGTVIILDNIPQNFEISTMPMYAEKDVKQEGCLKDQSWMHSWTQEEREAVSQDSDEKIKPDKKVQKYKGLFGYG